MKIAILGYGTVGRGVDRIVSERGLDIKVTRILELPQFATDPRMTSDFADIANDPSIEAVVECMGGIEPARSYILDALAAGKSVVTSNKAVVAANFEEFSCAAEKSGAALLIEATCGGGIPWIASIEKVRRIDEISQVSGIMNGTTNYIVDAMMRESAEFDDVLVRAQELGYAERDPSADIDGIDVANKTIIAVGVAFDTVCTQDLPVTGIRTLTKADLDIFAKHGRTVKLLGRAVQRDSHYAAAVEPVAVPLRSLEAAVATNFNIVSLEGTTVGPLKFYGQGAGSLPTGNAMVQDLLDLAAGRKPHYDFSRSLVWDPSLLTSDYLVRTKAEMPIEGEPVAEDAYIISALSAVRARELLTSLQKSDPSSFMAALPQED